MEMFKLLGQISFIGYFPKILKHCNKEAFSFSVRTSLCAIIKMTGLQSIVHRYEDNIFSGVVGDINCALVLYVHDKDIMVPASL